MAILSARDAPAESGHSFLDKSKTLCRRRRTLSNNRTDCSDLHPRSRFDDLASLGFILRQRDKFERVQELRQKEYLSEDYSEGIRAFEEKRKPDLKGNIVITGVFESDTGLAPLSKSSRKQPLSSRGAAERVALRED